MPFVLYAARAFPLLKQGYSLIRKWNALPDTERAAVQDQGRRAVAAIIAVKTAATAARSAEDPPSSWEEALEAVRNPDPAAEMAVAIVEYLQGVPEATRGTIAAAVGAHGKDDANFERALAGAQRDGYIHRSGVDFRGIKWDTTEWADRQVLDTPRVRELEERIVGFLTDFGLASLDHISGRLGLEDDAPELRAALERAIVDESLHWYGNGIYGLPLGRLLDFRPKLDIWAETKPPASEKDLGDAIDELDTAIRSLAAAMKATGIHRRTPAGEVHPTDESGDEPYEDLRRLGELRDSGVLTEGEYAAKKSELLARI